MKRMRWVGVILVMALLVSSTGSIFAQETIVKTTVVTITEETLGEFLANELEYVVSKDFIDFRLREPLLKYKERYELRFIPKEVSLFKLQGEYVVEVTIEKRVPLKVSHIVKYTAFKEKDIELLDVHADIYYRRRFKKIKEAAEYTRTLLPFLENKEISVKAIQYGISIRRSNYKVLVRENVLLYYGTLRVIFSEQP